MKKTMRIDLVLLMVSFVLFGAYCNKKSVELNSSQPIQTIKGITFVSIPGGTFQMGDEKGDLWKDCRPMHNVTVSSFKMSETEITNAQYCEYLNAALKTGGITADISSVYIAKGSHYWERYLLLSSSFDLNNRCWITYSNNVFSVVSGHENWPVVYVTWIGAKAFADYYGCDLPREAEWEYACRGGKQYLYGTDDGTLSSNKMNYTGINHPVSVKIYPKNPFGLYDMSGNVWELCSDYYGSYSSSPATNPTGPESSEAHIIRGGSWSYFKESTLRSAHRSSNIPEFANVTIGFRVVRR
ncbi:MAG: SUMF1/EgtB/PvdO family nonheme iron enzyme [Candidatus Latescibacter sp.]|nr:SUMF1/EgtB/PvdO family nonheme iron enzyme [Candidatus Latescibacter sp.]